MLEETAMGLKAEVLEVIEATDQAISKVKQLKAIEETRREGAMQLIRSLGADTLRNDLLEAFESLKAAYEIRVNSRESLRQAKDAFAVAEANAIVEVKSKGLFEEKDPVTKRPNKEWAEMQILQAVREIPEYRDAKKVLDTAQLRVSEAEMDLELATQRLSVRRNEVRLVAAMLGVGGNGDE